MKITADKRTKLLVAIVIAVIAATSATAAPTTPILKDPARSIDLWSLFYPYYVHLVRFGFNCPWF